MNTNIDTQNKSYIKGGSFIIKISNLSTFFFSNKKFISQTKAHFLLIYKIDAKIQRISDLLENYRLIYEG